MAGGEDRIYGGVEGGGTYSKLVLVRADGCILATQQGLGANYLLIGLDECLGRLHQMIEKAKNEAKVPANSKLQCIGLCLSGCEQEEGNEKLRLEFLSQYPDDTMECVVGSDTLGSVMTASANGGLVLIAGTGSNALLMNPDGSTGRCGGWGHLLGDEGGAMWISQKAVKAVFDADDNFHKLPFSVDCVRKLMKEHFKISDKFGMLEHCYVNFSKTFFALLCKKLAEAALKEKDELCCHLFHEAGRALGGHVRALLPKAHKSLLEGERGLPIVCVGSVFRSWELLKGGFLETLSSSDPALSLLGNFTLFRLTTSSALGAAYIAAQSRGLHLPLNFEEHSSILYQHKKCSNGTSNGH